MRHVKSLGKDYLPTLKSADVVIGNSSSGIIEAPSLGTPTINIGRRQEGRECAASVVSVAWDGMEPAVLFEVVRQMSYLEVAPPNPYYKDGKACASIHSILTEWLASR